MDEAQERRAIPVRVERADRSGRRGPQHRQSASTDAITEATRPKASAAATKADDFTVVGRGVPADDLDGIERRVGRVERVVQAVDLGPNSDDGTREGLWTLVTCTARLERPRV